MKEMPYAMTIGGKRVFTDASDAAINPATEKPICNFPLATRAHLDEAVEAARVAFPQWRDRPLAERQALVTRLGDLVEENKEAFIRLLITEQGKGRAGAEWEIGGSIYWLREVAKQSLPAEVVVDKGDEQIVTRHTPIGVVAGITPWNFPLLLAVWKIAPALVAGNTMVLKPSPFTPLCTLWFGELAQSVLPPGVLNILSGGNELGQWMTEHPHIGKVAFTGSTATGRKVMASAAANLKRLTLELGGNDPAIVLPDVDPKKIAKDLFWASFSNSAQFCVACKRLYIHEDIYDAVAKELVEYAKTVKVGNGLTEGVELGPIQNRMQFEKVSNLLKDCKDRGQRFLLGGDIADAPGYFIPVSLVDNPPEDSRVVVEEAFGPVLPLLKFKDIDDVVKRANNTPYGLAASVWSKDVQKAEAIASRLETGTVWINQVHVFSPDIAFGGHKQSGVGIENSLHGLAEYCNTQTLMRKPLAA
ncbi:acyl-CoA reductase-like NAD-dependent aldehyde dehydrogenase [Panacagrimonas perspica]|uniref:Acyl-CoA reductase-like NAD-dependent aldehyde dehydrogenase n=1 Tax=Panacagrimonas perspica TaxID=381431 RepID=A0A4R7NWY5_9GAMM|nr:aldehyde dehydrogenase family protein [Panacagrimonas perspica]TDU25608.1 acyl-CoA reductase-like NAD-dependent aldehyde dehydrogenase [Panacagrimonas perspica]THD03795.1 aldehyde dehydrogenase [Panacagrimonas perspica]